MVFSESKLRYEIERVENALSTAKRAARSAEDASSDDDKKRARGDSRQELGWASDHLRMILNEGFKL